jgi:hypothetical protein
MQKEDLSTDTTFDTVDSRWTIPLNIHFPCSHILFTLVNFPYSWPYS